MGPSVGKLNQAQLWCLKWKVEGECAHPTSTQHLMETFASTLPWVGGHCPSSHIVTCLRTCLAAEICIPFDCYLTVSVISDRVIRCFVYVGGADCDPGESHEHDVILFGRSDGRRERVVLDTLPYSSYRVRPTKQNMLS